MARAKDVSDLGRTEKSYLTQDLEMYRWREEFTATTGADGRFRMTGIGRERIVSLWIEGPTIATALADVYARTRPGPTYRLALQSRRARLGHARLLRRDVRLRGGPDPADRRDGPRQGHRPAARGDLDPERALRRQRDRRQGPCADDHGRRRPVPPGGNAGGERQPDHGQPRPGAALPRGRRRGPRRNRARGRPRSTSHSSAASRSGGRSPTRRRVSPCPPSSTTLRLLNNPHRADARELHGGEVRTRPDGSFELVGLRGRGLVAARALKDHYLVGQGAEKIAGADRKAGSGPTPTSLPSGVRARDRRHRSRRGCPVVGLRPGARPGADAARGPWSAPMASPWRDAPPSNLSPGTMSPNLVTLASEAFTAKGLDPKQPRPLVLPPR